MPLWQTVVASGRSKSSKIGGLEGGEGLWEQMCAQSEYSSNVEVSNAPFCLMFRNLLGARR